MDKNIPLPPSNSEAEMSILGSIMIDNDIMLDLEDITPKDFYNPDHSLIFSTMQKLYNENKPIDLVTVKEQTPSLSIDVLMAVSSSAVSTSTVNHYKKILIDKSIRRKIVAIGSQLMAKANEHEDTEDLLDKTEDFILSLRKRETKGYGLIRDNLEPAYTRLLDQMNTPGKIRGISTGFPAFDNKIGGLQNKKLYYIAARPAMGKTSLALQIATHASLHNIPTIIFSLEMGKEELTDRIISQVSRLNNHLIERGQLDQKQLEDYRKGAEILKYAKLVIVDDSSLTANQMKGMAKRIKKEFGDELGLIVIDYLTLMGGKGENNRIIVENNSKGLKQMSKDLDCPVLCLAQLSRACEARMDKRPILSDLRETGGIEQDADMAGFIYRDDYYNEDSDKKGIAEVLIRKNRGGSLGTVELVWIPETTSFYNYEQYRKEANNGRNAERKKDDECLPF